MAEIVEDKVVSVVCNSSFSHLWRPWGIDRQPEMCQMKPRQPQRPDEACYHMQLSLALPHLFLTTSLTLFFLIRWDVIWAPLSVTTIGCEISDSKACGNHSISCAHLAQHLYRRAGGFWKGEKSWTKGVWEAALTQTDCGNTFIPAKPPLLAHSFTLILLCKRSFHL